MKNLISLFSILLVGSLLVVGCKPSAENEGKYWENHKKNAALVKEKWPAFATAVDANIAAAQKMHDEAAKITDEEKKAEKMKEANGLVTSGVAGKAYEVQSKIEGLENDISSLQKLKLTKDQSKKRSSAVSEAWEDIDKVNTSMANAAPETPEQALEIADSNVGILIASAGLISRTKSAVQPKKKKKKKSKKIKSKKKK